MAKRNGWHMQAHTDIKSQLSKIEGDITELKVQTAKIIERDRVKTVIFGTIGGGVVTVVVALLKLFF